MGLFFELLNSINQTEMQGSVSQLNDVMTRMRQLGRKSDLSLQKTQSLLSALSEPVQQVLREQQFSMEDMFARFSGEYFDLSDREHSTQQAVQVLFPRDCQREMARQIAEDTELNRSKVQPLLTELLPTVMWLLTMGQSRPGAEGHNLVLESFLADSSQASSDAADLGKVFEMSHRFLGLEFS